MHRTQCSPTVFTGNVKHYSRVDSPEGGADLWMGVVGELPGSDRKEQVQRVREEGKRNSTAGALVTLLLHADFPRLLRRSEHPLLHCVGKAEG